ncbi:YybH family protein [Singulisphaera sp. PoT]|uniref:YybH family protein n=1 Tax=Singulisphaera sp. PoT TaxID=3411797 RepID=UPI003BF49978
MDRRHFLAATACLTTTGAAKAIQPEADADAAIRRVIQNYVEAREASDPKAIGLLFVEDADQLVSDGTWRRGREELVKGMLESSKKNPAKRTIEVVSVRRLAAEIALADGRYVQKARDGGSDRVMWTAITLKHGPEGWQIAAIRNMLPAKA